MKKVLFATTWTTNDISYKFNIPENYIVNLLPADQQVDELAGLETIRDFITYNTESIGCAVILNPYRWKEMTSPLHAYLNLSRIPTCFVENGWLTSGSKAFLISSFDGEVPKDTLESYIKKMTESQIVEALTLRDSLKEKKQSAREQEEATSKLPERYVFFPMHIEWHDYNNNGYRGPNEEFYRSLISFVNGMDIGLVIKRHPHSHKWKYALTEEDAYVSLLQSKVKKLHIFKGHIHDAMKNALVTATINNEKLILDAAITGSVIATCGESRLDMSESFVKGDTIHEALLYAINKRPDQINEIRIEQAKLIYYVINEIQSEKKIEMWIKK